MNAYLQILNKYFESVCLRWRHRPISVFAALRFIDVWSLGNFHYHEFHLKYIIIFNIIMNYAVAMMTSDMHSYASFHMHHLAWKWMLLKPCWKKQMRIQISNTQLDVFPYCSHKDTHVLVLKSSSHFCTFSKIGRMDPSSLLPWAILSWWYNRFFHPSIFVALFS